MNDESPSPSFDITKFNTSELYDYHESLYRVLLAAAKYEAREVCGENSPEEDVAYVMRMLEFQKLVTDLTIKYPSKD